MICRYLWPQQAEYSTTVYLNLRAQDIAGPHMRSTLSRSGIFDLAGNEFLTGKRTPCSICDTPGSLYNLLSLAEAAVKAESYVARSWGDISLLSGPPRLPSPVNTSSWKPSRNLVGKLHFSSKFCGSFRSRLPTTYFPMTGRNLYALCEGYGQRMTQVLGSCLNLLSATAGSNEKVLVLWVIIHYEITSWCIIIPTETHPLESSRGEMR